MGAEDNYKLEEIRNEKLHRLRLLEKRQSIEGFRTPPEIVIEIERTRRELGIVESAITHPADASMAEEMGAGGRFLALDRKLDLVIKMFSERMDRMEEHADERYRNQETKRDASAVFIRVGFGLLVIGLLLAYVVIAFIIGRLPLS